MCDGVHFGRIVETRLDGGDDFHPGVGRRIPELRVLNCHAREDQPRMLPPFGQSDQLRRGPEHLNLRGSRTNTANPEITA